MDTKNSRIPFKTKNMPVVSMTKQFSPKQKANNQKLNGIGH